MATEISFRGDVRESLNENREADRVNGTSEFAAGETAADRYDPFDRPPGELVPDRHARSNNEEMREAEESDGHGPAFEPDRYWDLSGSRAVEVELTPGGTPIRMSEDGNPIRSRRRR